MTLATPMQTASYTTAISMPASPMPYRQAAATPRTPWMRHPGTIAVAVVGLHVLALWAMQTGLLRRAVESVVPAEILVELWSPPAPQVAPAPMPRPAPTTVRTAKTPAAVATPTPLAVPAPEPVAVQHTAQPAITSVAEPSSNTRASDPIGTNNAKTTPTVAAPKVELPSSDADYLNNPKPPYPALSKRMGEQGRVVVRALIGTDGRAQEVQVQQSSGFDRLDQTALTAARQWRYVPGKRDGVPQAMWFNIPFTFQLQ